MTRLEWALAIIARLVRLLAEVAIENQALREELLRAEQDIVDAHHEQLSTRPRR